MPTGFRKKGYTFTEHIKIGDILNISSLMYIVTDISVNEYGRKVFELSGINADGSVKPAYMNALVILPMRQAVLTYKEE